MKPHYRNQPGSAAFCGARELAAIIFLRRVHFVQVAA